MVLSGESRESDLATTVSAPLRVSRQSMRRRWATELLIILGFVGLTALMTWPWVLHLRNAVIDRGDPYSIAWALWWDYHQTFHHPLHLFHANIFYPYQYTLAFTENDYGIALLFFPLFALGVRPLTVNIVATFLGFAFSGYGGFRLTRTATNSLGAAWIGGILFAFIPLRFSFLSHLHYLFAGWIPILLEALILFSRNPTRRRATWLSVAFLMNALTCLSWFIMTLVPLSLTTVFFVLNVQMLRRDRRFWLRGAAAICVASMALLPFLIPYQIVSTKYGLRWQPWEYAFNSASPIHWLAAEGRNKVWHNFGNWIPGNIKLFPGMLGPLLALAALRFSETNHTARVSQRYRRAVGALEVIALLAGCVGVLALGYEDATYRLFGHQIIRLNPRSAVDAASVMAGALLIRFWLAWYLRSNQIAHNPDRKPSEINAPPPDEKRSLTPSNSWWTPRAAITVGLIWTIWGFLSSLGANFFVNRWLHDYVLLFQSIRIPWRGAMICHVGLAVMAGLGAQRLALRFSKLSSHAVIAPLVFVLLGGAILFELHASPLELETGEVDPSALALRLKQTPMKGGLVELPSLDGLNRHFYMLRAADHERPLINAHASFLSPLTERINLMTRGPVPASFIDVLEQTPASYLVIHNERMSDERRADFQRFLVQSIQSGRLLFVNRFDNGADLYAITLVEPEARSEAPLPFDLPPETP